MFAYHLVARDDLKGWDTRSDYVPKAFAADGFIHCTRGMDAVVDTANRYYRDDPREYVVLMIDMYRIAAPVRYEDPDERYPHIHGPLNSDAVFGLLKVDRATDGTFLEVSSDPAGVVAED
ncbi:MAG: DUF952 domain-containing protein [Chloroflexota bacterium]